MPEVKAKAKKADYGDARDNDILRDKIRELDGRFAVLKKDELGF